MKAKSKFAWTAAVGASALLMVLSAPAPAHTGRRAPSLGTPPTRQAPPPPEASPRLQPKVHIVPKAQLPPALPQGQEGALPILKPSKVPPDSGPWVSPGQTPAGLQPSAHSLSPKGQDLGLPKTAPGQSGMNILETLFIVMKDSIKEQNEDKKQWLSKLKMYNALGDALSDHLKELNEAGANMSKPKAAKQALSADEAKELKHIATMIQKGEPQEAIKARWKAFQEGTPRGGEGADISHLIQHVLRESYLEQTEGLKSYAEKVKYFNEHKKAVREQLKETRAKGAQLKKAFFNAELGGGATSQPSLTKDPSKEEQPDEGSDQTSSDR